MANNTPRQMPPRWRRQKPDKPGCWALYRHNASTGNRFMVVRVTPEYLEPHEGTAQTVVDGWSADWWMPVPDMPNGG